MAHEFHLPDIGEGLTEAVIVHWYVDVGERVEMDAPLVEVETDKAVVDIPAPVAGVVLHHGGGAGATIAVESLLAVIGEAGEDWSAAEASSDATDTSAEAAPIVGTLAEAEPVVAAGSGVQALPRVRRLAAELGVDLASVTGSGAGGRITEDDVRGAGDSVQERGPAERHPMSPTRRAIADHMTRSWREIPHVTTYATADAAGLLRWRAELDKPVLEALLIQVLVPVLQRHPEFNAALDGNEIVFKKYYDIGVAVDTTDGLLVGVVRDVEHRSIPDLDNEIKGLAGRIRDRSAEPGELRGQTFTLSNIGAVGGEYGTPIVPFGTTAIVSFGRAEERPVVRDGALAVATTLPISVSYDHRVIDGAKGRAFVAALVAAIEAL